jgi:hypothetical protein
MSAEPYTFSSDEAVDQAIMVLKEAGVRYIEKKTQFQLKIGPFNYYPAKGTIYRDGEPKARSESGVQALVALLRKSGMTVAKGTTDSPPTIKLIFPD